jgi:predicted HTH transcriptional regulator
MDKETLSLFLKEGEGLSIEFKEKYTSKIVQDFVAMANSKGGHVILGVNEGEKFTRQLSKFQIKVLFEIKQNIKITTEELIQKLHVSESSIYRTIQILKKLNYITRVGGDKGGHWKVRK